MNKSPAPNWLARSVLRSIVMIVAIILILCLVVFLIYAIAITPILPQDRNTRSLYIILIPILLVALGITGVMTWSSFQILHRRRTLDRVFTPLGFESSPYLINGRQYRGNFSGRPVNIYFSRGPQMEIYIESTLRTRLSVTPADVLVEWIAKRSNEQAVPIDDPNFSHLVVYATDPDWAHQLFDLSEAREAILRLMDYQLSDTPQVGIQPGALVLRLPGARIKKLSTGLAQQKLSFLVLLSRLAESLPAPAQTIEASSWETTARTNRNAFLWPSLGLVLLILLAAFVAAAACVYGITLLQK